MIGIYKKKVNGIPVLEVVKQSLEREPLPTVFFIHGFTSAKEHNLHYAYLLAEKNIRTVLPEADLHGERGKSLEERELSLHFWTIVVKTIQELKTLKTEYVEAGRTLPDKIGVAGLSMGGIVTLGALSQYDWIKAAVSLMGSPAYGEFANYLIDQLEKQGEKLPFTEEELKRELEKIQPYDLSKQPEKLQGRPLLFWHGKRDLVVPYQYAMDFYNRVKGDYDQYPERLEFLLDDMADHKVTREGLLKTVDWFETYLS